MSQIDERNERLLDLGLNEWVKNLAHQGVLATDAELKIRTWNRWLELYSGRSAAEVIGRDLLEVYPELKERRLEKYYRNALTGQVQTLAQRFHGYLLPLRPSVAGLGFELMQQSVQIMPLLVEGRAVGTITIIDDVTERILTERELRQQITELERLSQALRESEQWLATILRSIGDAVIATDVEGNVTFMNSVAQELTGWSQEAASGLPLERVFKIFNEKTHAVVTNPIARVVHEGLIVGLANHTVLVSREGREIPIDNSGAPIKNDAGQIIGAVLVFRNVSERRQADAERERLLASEKSARAQAEAASRLKDEFLATVSHELRAPLNSILGWTYLLLSGKLDKRSEIHAIETIERNAKSQNQLIEDLLDVSRIITGKLRLDLRPVELPGVIEAALDTMRPTAEAKGIHLEYALDTSIGPIMGDADRLQQVVWNLVSNAIKFTPQGGRIDVRLGLKGLQAQVVVEDTGCGISPEFIPYVFDRFRQAESVTTRSQGGLGLGLAIVRHLVELHGGTVSAESRGEGQGATFKINFPLIGLSGQESSTPDVPETLWQSKEAIVLYKTPDHLVGVRVLVVDDEPDTLEICRIVLEQAGAEVRSVTSARAALNLLEDWRPDILISDIGMPDQDGYDLIRQVRAWGPERGGLLPAIALTAFARSEDRVRALGSGYQMHVPKPIDPTELVLVLSSLADRYRKY